MSERVLICGDRDWGSTPGDRVAMFDFVASLPDDAVVIHGDQGRRDGSLGADRMAARLARERGLEVVPFPADWRRYGRGAGPVRNQQMIDEGKPTRVAYAHRDLSRSRGTVDMVRRARRAGLPTEEVGGVNETRERLQAFTDAHGPEAAYRIDNAIADGTEDQAREQYGDQVVDDYFRALGWEPDAIRGTA